jgi:integrase
VSEALEYVTDLEHGKTTAPETEPVTSVSSTVIKKTVEFLPPTVGDMVLLQLELGCRPSEVCNVRWCDINQSDDIWIYEPFEHKTEHKKKRRLIAVRKNAQKILEKYRYRPENEFIFSPRETMKIVRERKTGTKLTKSGLRNLLQYNEKYPIRSYENAIKTAAKKAGVPAWAPNQMRHRFATDTDNVTNRETALSLLGHAKKETTEGYIDQDAEKIKLAARLLDQQEKKALKKK